MTAPTELPDGVRFTRSTPRFSATDVPAGLLAAHQLSASVWGVLRVFGGSLDFVVEATGEHHHLAAGESQVIEPEVRHHVEPGDDAVFVIDFYR